MQCRLSLLLNFPRAFHCYQVLVDDAEEWHRAAALRCNFPAKTSSVNYLSLGERVSCTAETLQHAAKKLIRLCYLFPP